MIELRFYGLNKNLKRNIIKRAENVIKDEKFIEADDGEENNGLLNI